MLRDFVCAVYPLVCQFTSTLDALSNVRFTPKKNYNTNLLEEGLLGTLVNGTVLLFDETQMNPGKIDNFGVENIKSLASLIENQNILMDFGYHSLELPISVPVIVLSDARTILKNTLHVPVTQASNMDEAIANAR